jgi:IclR family transcriptional regulator, acetate operon repressor
MSTDQADSRSGVQVIARAAAVLRALEQHPDGLSLGDIAKLVDLPRSTIQRIVDALGAEQLVMTSSVAGRIRLGPAILSLAGATKFELAELARDVLVDISRRSRETVDLSVIDQGRAVFIDQVAGSQRLRAVSAIGVSFPLHACAPGKAMLAVAPPELSSRIRRKMRLTAMTASTITSWEKLDEELAAIRARGFAFDEEENSIGISAVSAAVAAPTGGLVALSMPVPTPRFDQSRDRCVEFVLEGARKLASIFSTG